MLGARLVYARRLSVIPLAAFGAVRWPVGILSATARAPGGWMRAVAARYRVHVGAAPWSGLTRPLKQWTGGGWH